VSVLCHAPGCAGGKIIFRPGLETGVPTLDDARKPWGVGEHAEPLPFENSAFGGARHLIVQSGPHAPANLFANTLQQFNRKSLRPERLASFTKGFVNFRDSRHVQNRPVGWMLAQNSPSQIVLMPTRL